MSISPTFYKQLLRVKIPKVQKDANDLTGFFALLGSALVKGVCKCVGEIDPKKGDGVFLLSKRRRPSTSFRSFHPLPPFEFTNLLP